MATYNTAHPHTAGGVDEKYRTDGANSPGTMAGIGQPFTAPVHTAPILAMSVPHARLHCRACTARTFWARHMDVPPCAHCGGALDALDEV